MFIPLRDRNSLKTIPFQNVTVGLIAVNVVVFVVELLIGPERGESLWAGLGFTPAGLFLHGPVDTDTWHAPALLTLLTHSFLHENIWHLAGNMLFLWVFGDNVEDAMGPWRFLVFYLLLYPKSKIWILLFFRIPLLLPAYIVGAIFVATQLISAGLGLDAATAWYAHLGGFVAGALLVILMRRPGIQLFNPADPKPAAALAAAKDPPPLT